jgi:hypothetical protein
MRISGLAGSVWLLARFEGRLIPADLKPTGRFPGCCPAWLEVWRAWPYGSFDLGPAESPSCLNTGPCGFESIDNGYFISICYVGFFASHQGRNRTTKNAGKAFWPPVLFQQHLPENSISGCSKCLFFVACAGLSANVDVRRRGASQSRSYRSVRCQGTTKATGGLGGEGTKGTFQGEQRPTETDPSQDNKWRLR